MVTLWAFPRIVILERWTRKTLGVVNTPALWMAAVAEKTIRARIDGVRLVSTYYTAYLLGSMLSPEAFR